VKPSIPPSGILSNWFFINVTCGCGNPQSVCDLLVEWLTALGSGGAAYDLRNDHRGRAGPRLYGYIEAWMSVIDDLGLCEHGTSLPGWITPAGNRVLAALRAYPNRNAWEDGPTAEEDELWRDWPQKEPT